MSGLLLADSVSQTPDLSILAQYGVLGLFAGLLLIVVSVLYRRQNSTHDQQIETLTEAHKLEVERLTDERKRETERADRSDRALADLNNTVRNQVMTTLTEAQRAVTEAMQRRRSG